MTNAENDLLSSNRSNQIQPGEWVKKKWFNEKPHKTNDK